MNYLDFISNKECREYIREMDTNLIAEGFTSVKDRVTQMIDNLVSFAMFSLTDKQIDDTAYELSMYINREECLDNILDSIYMIEPVSIHFICDNGDIENYTFYQAGYHHDSDGNFGKRLAYDHDYRGLNSDGERYLDDVIEGDSITWDEIESIISRKDKGMWRPGWSNIDCDL